ncbi:MAG: sensor histidine kinase [Gammaproteobacteria bacterium]|nr:sensor histidine kinase [Gammaproteobacteria bacterium]
MVTSASGPRGRDRPSGVRAAWHRRSLAAQFVITGSVVLLVGMAIMGFWVTQRIEDDVVRNTAASTALYMESFVAPLVQELARSDRVGPEIQGQLDRVIQSDVLGRRIVSFKIWQPGGYIAYSSRPEIIGKSFPTTDNLRRAWQGEVTAEFDTLADEEDALERAQGLPLLEMYSPIREQHTGKIIAVAEFYETAEALRSNLFAANLQTWAVVATVTLSMLGALFGIVYRGSKTIDRQRASLERRVAELVRLLAQNEELRGRLQNASRRTTEINESYLRRISADLHDGPAQLLSLALLRIDALKPLLPEVTDDGGSRSDMEIVRSSLGDAIAEIRQICNGLALPELDRLTLAEMLGNVISSHERRTATAVELEVGSTPDRLTRAIKICVYRFVQEALSNAFRHAGGVGQKVVCHYADKVLEVEVRDAGPGIESVATDSASGLGLPGLRDRIESIGGELQIHSNAGQGTRLIMRCIIDGDGKRTDQ